MIASLVTGIDIRKALRSANLKPSDFDEEGLLDYCRAQDITDPNKIVEVATLYFSWENM